MNASAVYLRQALSAQAMADLRMRRLHVELSRPCASRDDGDPSVYADDANFEETKHPRGSDGKFTSGAGGGNAAKKAAQEYKASLKGKAGSAAGLIKHLLQAGLHEKDIFEAAKEEYGLTPDKAGYVSWYHKDLTKKGFPVPSLLKGSSGKPYHGEKETPKAAPPGGTTPASAPKPAKHDHGATLKPTTLAALDDIKKNLSKVGPSLKPALEQKLKDLDLAFDQSSFMLQKAYVAGINVIPMPGGMGQKSFNETLLKIKADYGITPPAVSPPTPAVAPTPTQQKKAQDGVYAVAAHAPHKRTSQTHYLEDHTGKEVKAVLDASTKNIPGNHYAKVTAAYGNNPSGMTKAVDEAMHDYFNDVHAKISPAQRKAIAEYRDGDYGKTNKALLKATVDEASLATKMRINHIREALKQSFVPADTPVYRGLSVSLKELTGFDDPEAAIGRCFEHKNFASVSRSLDTAKAFGSETVLHFTIPAGVRGVVMGGQKNKTSGPTEREILLDARTMFRIRKIEKSGNRHVVYCTYIGSRSDED